MRSRRVNSAGGSGSLGAAPRLVLVLVAEADAAAPSFGSVLSAASGMRLRSIVVRNSTGPFLAYGSNPRPQYVE